MKSYHLLRCPALTAACLFGVVLSQTTIGPSVTNTADPGDSSLIVVLPPACGAVNTSSCAACAPGTRYSNDTLNCSCCPASGLCVSQGDCLPCPRGLYQPVAAQELCLPCAQGFYTNSTGSLVCQPCPPGSSTNATGTAVCKGCAPGYYASQQNATSCEPCPKETFCNTSSCARCQGCPLGKESLQIASKECTPCRPGMHRSPEESMCRICSVGYYQIKWGQERCEICPEEHYCPSPDVNPIKCPNDAFCPEGSTSPGYCMETFFRKSGETCELAPISIALLVIAAGMALLCVILLILWRRKESDAELPMSRALLLRKDRPLGRVYGVAWDTEPIYAGW
ncbi:major surface-labeled trophozoite antigen 417-like [Polyodon spathula]|uniref:major surface-labeled trophozoite antigen 417-like n=1 Tax=Polyodon spathula TaxID=7913 RepID=UPI001B7DE2F1|nr:major surface-labeled trophozoite antigen 417-like [Polyodon spathula]